MHILMTILLLPVIAQSAKDSFRDWAQENAIQVQNWPQTELTDEVRAALDVWLQGKKIVYIGEPDHYIHEKYDFRLMLIDYLYEKGFHTISMEMGRSDGGRVNAYLQSGDPAHLDRVGLYGYKGATRTDRKDQNQGDLARVRQNLKAGRPNFYAEERWFLEQLQARNKARGTEKPNLRWFGYEVDTKPGGGYEDAEAILSKHTGAAVDEVRRLLGRVTGESLQQEVRRLDLASKKIAEQRKALVHALGKKSLQELERTVLTLADSFRFALKNQNDDMIEAFREREEVMFRQMDELLEELGDNGKLIVMGHNMHLTKEHQWASFGTGSARLKLWPTIGNHIYEREDQAVFSFWMLYDQGKNGGHQCPEADCEVQPLRNSISATLRGVGQAFFLPIRDLPFDHYLMSERIFRVNAGPGSGVLPKLADAIFFIPRATAPRKRE